MSSASTRSEISPAHTTTTTPTQSLRVARPGHELSRRPGSPKFFHASDARPARKPQQPTITTEGPLLQSKPSKFFYAADAAAAAAAVASSANPSAARLTPRLSTAPIANSPPPPIASPQQPTPLPNTRNVKFVYANGTEEVLEPRRNNPSTSDGSSRPPSPNPYTPGQLSPSVPSPKPPTSTPSSVLSSPTQRAHPPMGRRASIESSKVRKGRALSVGANGAVQEIFLAPEALRSPKLSPANAADDGSPAPIAISLKMREELAANARRERKVC